MDCAAAVGLVWCGVRIEIWPRPVHRRRFVPIDTSASSGIRFLRNAVRLRARGGRRRGRLAIAGYATLALVALAFIFGVGTVFNLARAPLTFESLPGRVAEALKSQIGPDWAVEVESASITWRGTGPGLDVGGVAIRNPAGQTVLRAPRGTLDVDALNLAVGQFRPTAIALAGLDLRLFVDPDGSLRTELGSSGAATAGPAPDAAAGSLLALIAGTDGLFGELARAELRDARLILIDQRRQERVAFRNVRIALDRLAARYRRLTMEAEGAGGPWTVTADIAGRRDTERDVALNFSDVSVADLWLMAGQAVGPVDRASAVSGQGTARVLADGSLGELKLAVGARDGRIRLLDQQIGEVGLEDVAVDIARDEAGGYAVRSLRIHGGGTELDLKGSAARRPEGGWAIGLAAPLGSLSGLGPGDRVVPLSDIAVNAVVAPSTQPSTLDVRMLADGGTVTARVRATPQGDGTALAIEADGARLMARDALRIWPVFAAGNVRRYLRDHLLAGSVEQVSVRVNLSPEMLSHVGDDTPWPPEAVDVRFRVANARYQPSPGLPPLTEAVVDGAITARSASVKVASARVELPQGRSLRLTEGAFTVPETSRADPPATIGMRIAGRADGLMALLASEDVKKAASIALDPSTVSGEADLRVGIDLALTPTIDPAKVGVTAQGSLSGLVVEKAFGPERLEGANLQVSVNRQSVQLRGEGRMFGLPVGIEVRPAGGVSEAVLTMNLDEAARRRRGINLGRRLTGPVAVRAAAPLGTEGAKPRVEIDLARAAVDDLVPGWTKPAGRPGRITLAVGNKPGALVLEDIQIEGPSLTARGSAELKPDLALVSADFDGVKLSPGDSIAVGVSRTGQVTKVSVSGAVLDARPFLKALQSAPAGTPARGRGQAEDGDAGDIDLELSLPILAGFNDEAVTQARMKLSRRNGEVRELRLDGRIGAADLSAQLVRDAQNTPYYVVQTQDGGGLMRFVDLYRRMVGGDLVLRLTASGAAQNGDLTVREFGLRDEPALRRIISEQPLGGSDDRAAAPQPIRGSGSTVSFTKLRGDFTRSAGRVDIRDAVMWGPQVGLNIEGAIDYGRDRVELNGTFVPAYGLNNAFAQVPLFGPLLGGSSTEGLFAVNFRVSGAASAPTLTINPLSFVTPGIFRKFFDAFRGDPSTANRPTGSVPSPPSR